ncbi:MAG: VaFE repeat-containing surface-anchored protein [Coriobacteriaceae bacterium]|nr:VaFE repeat-containing surface-anchored protein [Coriobacteriaceae bacterium]
MVLAFIALLFVLTTCTQPAYAATTITFSNGGTATLNDDGSIDGTCQSQRSTAFALYRDGDPNDPGPSVPTPFYVTMPDGQRITAYCQDGENFAPRDGSIPFTAYPHGGSYTVWIWGNRVDVNAGEVAAWAAAGRSLYYPAQRLYASYWKPSIQGDISLSKTSADIGLSTGNTSYGLEGAVYGIFSDSSCTHEVGRLTTDASGYARSGKLDAGAYWVRELTPSPGFALDETVHRLEVTSGTTTNLGVDEEPQRHPIALLLTKADADLHEPLPQGDASLAGARFLVRLFGNADGDVTGTPLRTWLFETDADGSIVMDENHLVSGDDFFLDGSGAIVLPLGTLSIQELTAPATYYLEGTDASSDSSSDAPLHVCSILSDGTSVEVSGFEPLVVEEQVKRGGLSLDKDDDATISSQGDAHLDGTVFEVINLSEHDVVVSGTRFEPGAVVTTLVTDRSGRAATAPDLLPLGTYEVREAEPGAGYLDTSEPQTVTIDAAGTVVEVTAPFTNTVIRGGLRVGKVGAETADRMPQGAATLAGACFGIWSRSEAPVLVDGALFSPDSLVYTLITDESGVAELPAGTLPYGTYEVRELEAPEGYLVDESWSQTVLIREDGAVVDISEPEDAAADQVKRGGLTFNKADEETMAGMPGVPFLVTALDDPDSDGLFEQHIIVTDANGVFDSEFPVHSSATNASDAAYDPETGTVDESLLDPDAGIWFSGRTDIATAPDDARGALPYGSYTVEELPCSANEGRKLVRFTLSISYDGRTVDRGTIDDRPGPRIATELASEAGKVVPVSGGPTILTDRIQYANLDAGETYRVSGELVDGRSGDSLGITAERTFTPFAETGSVELEFPIDPEVISTDTIVAFEELWLGDELVASHAELDDGNQTVLVPSIGTTLTSSDGSSVVSSADEMVSLVDTVSFRGLWPGESYRVEGSLYDRETGEPLGVTAAAGFVAEGSEGTVEVAFEIPSDLLAGKTVVCFETLVRDGHVLAVHADLEDEAQTVTVPAIGTTLTDGTGSHETVAEEDVVELVDTVLYQGVLPGVEHRLVGTLVDRSDGSELAVEEISFVPDESSGAVEVAFTVDAALVSGRTVVAFEDLYCGDATVARHADIDDEGQTVRFPELGTSLADADGRTGLVPSTDPLVLVDTVSYRGLTPGSTYLLKGSLMDKGSGEPLGLEAQAEFVPDAEEGSAEVVFVCDGALVAGKDVVAFETLSHDGTDVIVHADLEDAAQTVSVPALRTRLAEKGGGRKTVEKGRFTLEDTVSYTNLTPRESYIMTGRLMDARTGEPFLDANGKPVCAEETFTAEGSEGTCIVTFTVDASSIAADTQLIAFETLFDGNDVVLASHEDLNDADQTVTVRIPETPERARVPKTGDVNDPLALRLAAASGAAVAAAATIVSIRTSAPPRKRSHRRRDGH